MSAILAIDPGTHVSAWLEYSDGELGLFGIDDNAIVLAKCRGVRFTSGTVVIEQVASYGMPVGAEVFETVYWSGRFAEAAHPLPVERITRLQVKTTLCHSAKANDASIRQALIDRYGGSGAIRKGGALYGVSRDVWAALAVAVAWQDRQREQAA